MARDTFKAVTRGHRHEIAAADDFPDTVSVDLDGKDDEYEIVVTDDTPEEDRGRPTEWTGGPDREDRPAGKSDYQKRINRLKAETETERRGREAVERERDEAVRLIQAKDAELADLRRRSDAGGAALAASMKSERENKLADAKRRLSAAHADGDSEAIAQATEDMSTASAELAQIIARTPAPRPAGEQERQPAAQPQRQQAPQLAPNVAGWIAHNDRWFNKDQAKTRFAMSIHEAVTARGVRPESPEYTAELDKGMKAMYPDHQAYRSTSVDDGLDDDRQERSSPRRTNVVDRGARDTGANPNPRRVELTATQVALANKLKIPLKVYAAEVLKMQKTEQDGA